MAHDIDCVLGLETISTSWPDHGMFKQASIFQIRYPYLQSDLARGGQFPSALPILCMDLAQAEK